MYTMKKIAVMMMAGLLSFMPGTDAWAQRQQQTLGRGVVAVKNGSNVFLSWRRLAQEPEDAMYNVYVDGKKINPSPLSRTNYMIMVKLQYLPLVAVLRSASLLRIAVCQIAPLPALLVPAPKERLFSLRYVGDASHTLHYVRS